MIYGVTPAYSISKAALIALTMKAAVELVNTSIQVILLTLDGWLQTLVSWGRPVQEGEVNNLRCIIIDDRSGENFSVMVELPRQIYTKNKFHSFTI
jgi:hypothetical protein